jgi:hypothetical protein
VHGVGEIGEPVRARRGVVGPDARDPDAVVEPVVTACESEWMIPSRPDENACAAMYCAHIMFVIASMSRGFAYAWRRLSSTSWTAFHDCGVPECICTRLT